MSLPVLDPDTALGREVAADLSQTLAEIRLAVQNRARQSDPPKPGSPPASPPPTQPQRPTGPGRTARMGPIKPTPPPPPPKPVPVPSGGHPTPPPNPTSPNPNPDPNAPGVRAA